MTFLAGIFGKDLVHERSAKQQLVYVTRLYYTVVVSHTIDILSKNLTFFQYQIQTEYLDEKILFTNGQLSSS